MTLQGIKKLHGIRNFFFKIQPEKKRDSSLAEGAVPFLLYALIFKEIKYLFVNIFILVSVENCIAYYLPISQILLH